MTKSYTCPKYYSVPNNRISSFSWLKAFVGNKINDIVAKGENVCNQLCTCVSWVSYTSINTAFFPKPPVTFLTCFSRGERQKHARKEVRLKRVWNSQPPGLEPDIMLTTETPGGTVQYNYKMQLATIFSFFHNSFKVSLFHDRCKVGILR